MKQSERTQLENRRSLLNIRHSRLCEMYHDDYSADNSIMLDVINETLSEVEKIDAVINKQREYLFNFVGGGWNSELAYTVEEAKEQAIIKYGKPTTDSKVTNIDLKTFRVSTPTDYSNLLSLFH